jgi:hypothetical protein
VAVRGRGRVAEIRVESPEVVFLSAITADPARVAHVLHVALICLDGADHEGAADHLASLMGR